MEVGFEDRLEHDLRCRHDHPVGHSGNAERAGLPWFARLGNVHSPQRLRPISPGPKLPGESIEKGPNRLCVPGFDIGDAHAVDPRGALVGGHVSPRSPHHVAAGELVEESVEATRPILLGAAIKHALKGSNGVQAISLSDGPSRDLGTHQRSSLRRRAPMKQGPFARAGCVVPPILANTAPSDSLSAAGHFPGSPVIGKLAPDSRRIGAE